MSYERLNTAAEIADGLRAVATKLDTLGDAALPRVYVALTIIPSGGEDVEVAAIDMLGEALFGKPGETRHLSGGGCHHGVKAAIDGVNLNVFTSVTSPEERERTAEIARLRAEVEALRAGQDGTR